MYASNDIKECDPTGVCEAPVRSQNMPIKNNEQKYETIEVIYGYDALCGWCYGFSAELEKMVNSFGKNVKFTLINGGIFAGDRSLKMGKINDHIKRNMPNVTQTTGVDFGLDFKNGMLNDENYNYDSKKASIAVMIVREIKPEYVFDFSSKIQRAFFYSGLDIQSDEFYINLIKEYGIDSDEFLIRLSSYEYDKKIDLEFIEASEIGFTGYPACAIRNIDGIAIINQGYSDADSLVSKINSIIGRNYFQQNTID